MWKVAELPHEKLGQLAMRGPAYGVLAGKVVQSRGRHEDLADVRDSQAAGVGAVVPGHRLQVASRRCRCYFAKVIPKGDPTQGRTRGRQGCVPWPQQNSRYCLTSTEIPARFPGAGQMTGVVTRRGSPPPGTGKAPCAQRRDSRHQS
jgi:hypothetical protein